METLTAHKLAEVLQEPNLALLRHVLGYLGSERTAELLAETLQCEANGGILTLDGTRRRTPGGTFFHLVRQQISGKARKRLFPVPKDRQIPNSIPPQILTWEDVKLISDTLATALAGEAKTMKLTLIGRPGKVEVRQTAVVFRMQGKPPSTLPKGLPAVPAHAPLTWTVMVALRQWNRVKESLASHEDDQLIIEGYPLMQGAQPTLLAQSCISMLQQRAHKQAQQQLAQTQTS